MTKAIIFDLGKVLVPFDFQRGYSRLEPLCGISASEIPERLRSTGLVQRFESGGIESRDFFEQLSSHLNLRASYDDFCEIWSSIFLPETLIPDSMIADLASRYPLILLSNTNAIHFEMIQENYPILRHFRNLVLSYKVGAMKPSPVIYQAAIEAAGCRPEECFFTDDIAEYVAGAKQQGIDAVQFHSAEQIRHELRARGVEVREAEPAERHRQ